MTDGVRAMITLERLTPERRRELTREALLHAAATVFATRGFHRASLDEVADAAGFSKGAIYSNFGSKDELFLTLVEHWDAAQLAEFGQLVTTDDTDLTALLDRVARALSDGRDRDALLLETEVWLHAQRDPRLRERYATHQRAHLAAVARLIVDAADSAGIELRLAPPDLAGLLVAATTGIAQLREADQDAGHQRLFGLLLGLLTDAAITTS